MKAILCYDKGICKYEDVPEPSIKDNFVKIKVAAAGFCGSDIVRAFNSAAHYYPIVLGHEFSGIVSEIGNGVENIKVGDHCVVAQMIPCYECEACKSGNYSLCENYDYIGTRQPGGMQEYVVVPKENVLKISSEVPLIQAALIEPSAVCRHAMLQNKFEPGGYTLILGAGTMGYFTIQWAKILGSKKVIALSRNQKRLDLAKKLGADESFSTLDPDFKKKCMEATNGHGFDYVFETAGSTATMHYAFELAAKKAHVCFVGTPKTDLTYTPNEWEIMNRKEFYLTGSWNSFSAPFPGPEWFDSIAKFESGEMKFYEDIFYAIVPASQCQRALDMFKNEKVSGRIIFDFMNQ